MDKLDFKCCNDVTVAFEGKNINLRHTCAAMVTVVGSVCVCMCVHVCVCVCYPTSHLSNVYLSHKRYDLRNGQ